MHGLQLAAQCADRTVHGHETSRAKAAHLSQRHADLAGPRFAQQRATRGVERGEAQVDIMP